jgi:hypothetical protein
MSFLKKLFGLGGGDDAPAAAKPLKTLKHKGFLIAGAPFKEGGQWQTAGTVSKDVDGVTKEHKFIRADRFGSADEAAEFALSKGRQIIDEQGERMFR